MKRVKQNRVFNPYTACMQVNSYHSEKQEDRIADKHKKRVTVGKSLTNSWQDCDIRYEGPETKVMQSRQKSRSGEIRIRSGHISHKLERLGINQ